MSSFITMMNSFIKFEAAFLLVQTTMLLRKIKITRAPNMYSVYKHEDSYDMQISITSIARFILIDPLT